jgi:WD40 repeat protein
VLRSLPLPALAALFLFLPGRARAAEVSATSPAGDRVAVASGKVVTVSDLQTQKVLMKMQAHKAAVTALAYAPDGKLLASANADGGLVVFDAATGKTVWVNKALAGVKALQFSKDGKKVKAVAPGGTRVFSLATGKQE